MSKSNHFFGQPLYGQLINLLDKEKISLEMMILCIKEHFWFIRHFE